MSITLIAISDTHSKHRFVKVPEGDILIHAGDITNNGNIADVIEFNSFLGTLPHKHKIVIAGNHDFCFERDLEYCRSVLTNCIYLQDEKVTIQGINFYGSPWQPWFYDWAFNLERGPEIRVKWDLIPKDTDVLITHGPPFGYGDMTSRGERTGCEDLLDAVHRIKPKVHIFGHIHEDPGVFREKNTTFINASTCTLAYKPENKPIVYKYEK